MVRVGFHKGVVSLDEGGVWGFGVMGEGGRTGKEEKRGRMKGKKMAASKFFKIKYKNKKFKWHTMLLIPLTWLHMCITNMSN